MSDARSLRRRTPLQIWFCERAGCRAPDAAAFSDCASISSAIEQTVFNTPICPVYQNVTASAISNPDEIKKNLVLQLTAPVRWTQTMKQMLADGATEVIEVGPGKVLQGLFKKVDREIQTISASIE